MPCMSFDPEEDSEDGNPEDDDARYRFLFAIAKKNGACGKSVAITVIQNFDLKSEKK